MENKTNQFKINKEVKRHKSAIIPPGPVVLNNYILKDNSSTESNKTISTNEDGVFRLKSNSIFAYQEFDKFTSFCDNETNNDNLLNNEDNKKSTNNLNNLNDDIINKEDLNSSSSYSLKEFTEDHKKENIAKKRKSAFDSMPPYFAQYLTQNVQNVHNIEEMPNFDKNYNNNIFNNLMNNQYSSEIRRTQTEKQVSNFINIPFMQGNNNMQNNKETFSNFEMRRKSQGFIPMYNYNAYNQNYNAINNFKNIFYLNRGYNSGLDKIPNEKQNIHNDNIKINNEKKDIPFIINDINESFQKKRNSLALPSKPMYSPIIKTNYLYPPNNENLFSLSSKNIVKNKKQINNNMQSNNNYSILYIFQDQSNCRNIQAQLELHKNNIKYIENFFEQIKPDIINLMEHQFGNYVIQKLFEILIYQENKALFKEIISIISKRDKLYELCINNYGTRVIQKTIEKLTDNNYSKIETPELDFHIKNLISKHLYDLCCDKNGNHVYQKLLKVFYSENDNKNDFLYDYLSDISLDVALLQQGATIFTTALSLSSYKQKEKVCLKIINNIEKLVNDKYGNYSVQAIINKLEKENNLIEPIYVYISDNIVELSKQKYSSNVIDTFIMKKDDFSKRLVNDMVKKNVIQDIIKDQFGNYVIQKAMSICDTETFNKIVEQIKPIIPELLENNIGKKVYDKLSQQYSDVFY